MLLRAAVFLGMVAFLAWLSLQVLVGGEVRRVVSVHVFDKSEHLVDMLTRSSVNMDALRDGNASRSDFATFFEMAHSSSVLEIMLFDPKGTLLGRVDTVSAGGDEKDHGGHSGLIETADGKEPNGDGAASIEKHRRIVPLSRSELRNLIGGYVDNVIRFDEFTSTDGMAEYYALPVLPVRVEDGTTIGFIGFVMSVTHIYETYAAGVKTFGTVFMICGIVLFAVPATAFWLQKQMAERSSRSAKYLSRYDPLTGLLNRSAFTEMANDWLKGRRARYAAYLDVDRFKLINDTHGHAVGDAVLRQIAGLIKSRCGADALIARMGGDEFTFLLPQEFEGSVDQIAENLLKDASSEFTVEGVTIAISISIGIAEAVFEETLDGLLQRADTALFFAKAGGRNAAAVYTDDMGKMAFRRWHIELCLRNALRDEGFSIAYQPLVSAKEKELLGFEALLRLDDDEGGAIRPDEFIPIAEEIGLIEDIGTWVLHKATRDIADFDGKLRVSINLSPEQFRSGKLIQNVSDALRQSGLEPDRLELEITESLLLDHDEATSLQIDALKELGVSLAMDDFGTGYSSLSTLWKYRFDRLKIDRSFVSALEAGSERSLEMIRSIIVLGAGMGMSVTVEGIETKEQCETVVALGGNVLQGFLFGRPAPLSTFAGSKRWGKPA